MATASTITPTLISRSRAALREDPTDRAALTWIARFRFVTAELLAQHLGVSHQSALARTRRLEAAGLIERRRTAPQQARTIAATAKGLRALGLPARRPSRTDVQREHELALAWLVTRLERGGTATVLTERECRQRERERSDTHRYSADLLERHDRTTKRWPDLIVERPDGHRLVLELERTLKGTSRLRQILAGYRRADWFDEVRLLCTDPAVATTLHRLVIKTAPAQLPGLQQARPAIIVAPWPGLAAARKRAVQAAIDPAAEHAR